jgi:hypothetical protein
VGSEDGFRDEEFLACLSRSKSIEMRDDLYAIVFSAQVEELKLAVLKGCEAVLATAYLRTSIGTAELTADRQQHVNSKSALFRLRSCSELHLYRPAFSS